jgi:hypothetical protein
VTLEETSPKTARCFWFFLASCHFVFLSAVGDSATILSAFADSAEKYFADKM